MRRKRVKQLISYTLPMNSISEHLAKIKIVKGRLEFAKLTAKSYTKPLRTDIDGIGAMYEKFKQVCDPGCKDNTKLFVLLVYYFYDPVSLVNKRMPRGNVRKEVGKVLGISRSVVSRHFADAKSLFYHHKGFRDEAERIFAQFRD